MVIIRQIIVILFVSLGVVLGGRYLLLDNLESYATLVARLYFNQDYYLDNYPEVKGLHIKPFEHYMTIGWKENKKPNKNFDTKFYYDTYISHYHNHSKYKDKFIDNPLLSYSFDKMFFQNRPVYVQ